MKMKNLLLVVASAAVAVVSGRAQIATGSTIGTSIVPLTQQIPIGPELDVVPFVSADGYTIQMTLLPSTTEFLGYDNPGQFNVIAQGGSGSTVGGAITAPVPLPRLRVRSVVTTAVVWDGQTVVLGGLISENVTREKAKLPVLGDLPLVGRLFRNEFMSSSKKNLVIFVTPQIIDPAGNRVHTDDSLPYDPNRIPPQAPFAPVTAPNPNAMPK